MPDPLKILATLQEYGTCSYPELMLFGINMTRNTLQRHMKGLKDSGLVNKRPQLYRPGDTSLFNGQKTCVEYHITSQGTDYLKKYLLSQGGKEGVDFYFPKGCHA